MQALCLRLTICEVGHRLDSISLSFELEKADNLEVSILRCRASNMDMNPYDRQGAVHAADGEAVQPLEHAETRELCADVVLKPWFRGDAPFKSRGIPDLEVPIGGGGAEKEIVG